MVAGISLLLSFFIAEECLRLSVKMKDKQQVLSFGVFRCMSLRLIVYITHYRHHS